MKSLIARKNVRWKYMFSKNRMLGIFFTIYFLCKFLLPRLSNIFHFVIEITFSLSRVFLDKTQNLNIFHTLRTELFYQVPFFCKNVEMWNFSSNLKQKKLSQILRRKFNFLSDFDQVYFVKVYDYITYLPQDLWYFYIGEIGILYNFSFKK